MVDIQDKQEEHDHWSNQEAMKQSSKHVIDIVLEPTNQSTYAEGCSWCWMDGRLN